MQHSCSSTPRVEIPALRLDDFTMHQTLKNFINGEFITPSGPGRLDIVNPTNGEVVAQAPVSGQEDVDAAMSSARAAFRTWQHVPRASDS